MDGKQVKNKANPTGTGKYLNESGAYVNLPTAGSPTVTEVEVDFGEEQFSKTFTITDALSTVTSKILCFPSPNPGTDRIGNDWELEVPSIIAVADEGFFNVTISFNDIVSGKRKIYYQIIN
jgi:hypothetical protein